MSTGEKILIVATCIIGCLVVYFGCLGLGTLVEHWIWHVCSNDSVDVHVIKPLYGSFVLIVSIGLSIAWAMRHRRFDYERLYNDIRYEDV